MKQIGFPIILVILLCSATAQAQLDSIQQLPDVLLSDSRLIHFSKGFKLESLSDSLVEKNSRSLTETLRYNSSIYFKENGFGMVSSPSFRGTNAGQTAVIWNGININSVFTGQTDFNTISPLNYDTISIRSGGGGVQYGSGAVGGSIHLNNEVSFIKINTTTFGLGYGSFSTVSGNFKTRQANRNNYLDIAADFINSKNNYEYIGKNRTNVHGAFQRFSANANAAKKWKNQRVSWNSEYTYNNRDFSGSLNTIGKDGYQDIAVRNRINWQAKTGLFTNSASGAHLFEEYKYFPNTERPKHDGGRANTYIGILQTEVLLNKTIRINAKAEYSYTSAEGDNIGTASRETLAMVLLMNHKISEKFNYGLNLRKEFLNGFDNPFLFSADAKYKISEMYALRLNGSKNYRVPTFNDLYWYAGGNIDLQPETSYQMELGQEFVFKDLHIDVAAYYISSQDLIKWIPGNGNLWKPINISETRNYGLEGTVNYSLRIKHRQRISLSANYSYTKAEDLQKNKQLIYVPYHKANGTLQYYYRTFSVYVQTLYTGYAFTTTDNSATVDASTNVNAGAELQFASRPEITLGARIKNVFNTYYENVAYRPMPSRYFEIFLKFNI